MCWWLHGVTGSTTILLHEADRYVWQGNHTVFLYTARYTKVSHHSIAFEESASTVRSAGVHQRWKSRPGVESCIILKSTQDFIFLGIETWNDARAGVCFVFFITYTDDRHTTLSSKSQWKTCFNAIRNEDFGLWLFSAVRFQ